MTPRRPQRFALLTLTIALASCGATRANERSAGPSFEKALWAKKVESIDSSLTWGRVPTVPPVRRAGAAERATEFELVAVAD